ncbi:MAG: iron-sulfur cluster-binding protein [Bacteroidales bacterium]|nr:iron-sulfur cluster-binding protein [Bacteroidales bacterium]
MTTISKKFTKDSEIKAFDINHRNTLKFNISRYHKAVNRGKKQFNDLEFARNRASNIKHKIINDLENYLTEFESNFTKRGGKIIWAEDSNEAIKEIIKILKKHNTKNVVKSKSMTTEEIELNHSLEKNKIESLETDLGEYIVQLNNQKPYHIVTPAMHLSKEDIAKLFNEKFKTPENSSPEEITAFVRQLLREKFTEADVGITGANFLISDIGGVGLTENEGNGVLSMSFPKIHIAITGIEKLIPSLEDLNLFWPLLSTHGTGQNITVYNSIITGPKQENEIDGPEEMYVVLLDNNRTNLLSKEKQRRALSCIRCGACLNNCPVYKNIGGHAYSTTYSGPIGSVITPYLNGMNDYKHLSFASSLCGRCTENCPVKIPLHQLLLYNRNASVKESKTKFSEKLMMFAWKKVMLNRFLMDIVGGNTKNIAIKMFFKKIWGPRRKLPKIQPKSFRKLWKERRK